MSKSKAAPPDAREAELLDKLTNNELQTRIDEAMMELPSVKQAVFFREYVSNGGDMYQAAVKAKFGDKSKTTNQEKLKKNVQKQASDLIRSEQGKRVIALLMQQINRSCIVNVDWWLRENVAFYRECREMQPTLVNEEGEVVAKDHRNGTQAGAALDRIGKHVGAYKAVTVELGDETQATLRDILKQIHGKTTGIPGGG